MTKKKLLTLDDLYNFYVNQNISCSFNSKSSEDTIVVQVEENMTFEESYDPTYGLLKTHLKSCHLYRNRNGSSISEESMNQAIPSFYNRPILGFIHQLEDGSYDFAGHEMTINNDGTVDYQEIPLGVIPESCNAQLVYDDEKDKTYLEIDGYIFEDYTKAADILRQKGESKVSVEIAVDELSYSAKDKVMNIEKFHFLGVTILGCTADSSEIPIEEGMYGSNITLKDFSKDNNSVFSHENSKLIESINKLNESIESLIRFSESTKTEGGMTMSKLDELLEEYEKTVDDLDFDYENMTDEELEAKFEEVFGCKKKKKCSEEPVEPENDPEPTPEPQPESEIDPEPEVAESFQKVFEISHEDIRCALYSLLASYEEADNEWYYISAVYDNYFAYEGYCSGLIYGQKYIVDGDNVSFDGERYTLHRELLTDAEYAELQSMRANYSSICDKLNTYEKAELNAKRNEVLSAEEYSVLADDKDFIALKENMEQYSVEELSKEADLIFAKHVKAAKTFSMDPGTNTSKPKNHGVFFSSTQNTDNDVRKPYGGIFENYKKKQEVKQKAN